MVTWFETGAACTREATAASGASGHRGYMVGHPLPENGYAATFAGERKICTSATDNIIEVSTHPSGVGFERWHSSGDSQHPEMLCPYS